MNKGNCSICGKELELTKANGLIPVHRGPEDRGCKGSQRDPAENKNKNK